MGQDEVEKQTIKISMKTRYEIAKELGKHHQLVYRKVRALNDPTNPSYDLFSSNIKMDENGNMLLNEIAGQMLKDSFEGMHTTMHKGMHTGMQPNLSKNAENAENIANEGMHTTTHKGMHTGMQPNLSKNAENAENIANEGMHTTMHKGMHTTYRIVKSVKTEFYQEQIKKLQTEINKEREYNKQLSNKIFEQSNKIIDLSNKLTEITENQQVLLKNQQIIFINEQAKNMENEKNEQVKNMNLHTIESESSIDVNWQSIEQKTQEISKVKKGFFHRLFKKIGSDANE